MGDGIYHGGGGDGDNGLLFFSTVDDKRGAGMLCASNVVGV